MHQDRWDSYGKEQLGRLRRDASRYEISAPPSAGRRLAPILGNIEGLRILDLGCGRGEWAVWLAKQGALVSAVDLGASLLEAAQELAEINGVICDFRQGDIVSLPFEEEFDIVTGLAILHHLTEHDVVHAVSESRRVLKPGGKAYFVEPIENSRVFDFSQNLIPIGGRQSRPSILSRKKWKQHLARRDDRAMSDAELRHAGSCFGKVHIRHYGLLVRLSRIIGQRQRLMATDEWILKRFPSLGRYGQSALITYSEHINP